MITMNQVEGQESHLYDAVRMIFGVALLVMGLLMAVAGLMSPGGGPSLPVVTGVALAFMAVGGGMLARQGWSRWGFYLLAGMTVIGAGEAAIRTHVLERSVAWDRPIAVATGLFFAWGIWMLSRPGAKQTFRG
jgi:cation transport ATPase